MLYRFPEPKFNEVVMIGRKRTTPLTDDTTGRKGFLADAYNFTNAYYREWSEARGRYAGVNSVHELPVLGTFALPWVKGHPQEPPPRPMTRRG